MSKIKTIMPLLALSAIVVGCAKEREYETVYKDPEIASLASIDQDGEFLYVGYTLGVPRFTKSARPFTQGKEKLVKFRFTEDALVAYELEKDERHIYNKLNSKPIVTIPAEYKSFKCQENSNKECTNSEEENSELEWFQKDKFIPDYAATKVLKNDSMGLPDKNDECFSETGSRLVNVESSNDVLNIEVEKTYKFSDSWSCIKKLYYNAKDRADLDFKISDAGSFHVRAFHSFVKLDKLATKGYTPIDYKLEDHNVFGFFKRAYRVEDNTTRVSTKYLMNRWNPGREVVFHLSDEYARPENAFLAKATYNAVEKMNSVLKRNKVKLSLKVEAPSGKNPGDLRNNMIVLVEGLATSLLGYGPTVTDPKTGEIIKAHTNMYKGTLTSTVPSVWKSIQSLEEQISIKKKSAKSPVRAPLIGATNKSLSDTKVGLSIVEKNLLPLSNIQKKNTSKHNHGDHNHSHASIDMSKFKQNFKLKKLDEKKLMKTILKDAELTEREKFSLEQSLSDKKMYEEMNRNNVYTVDMFNIQTLGKTALESISKIKGTRDQAGKLLDWDLLSKEVQTKAIEEIIVHVYTSTLVHELGHNLGLRHNFQGSHDKANFYTEAERKVLDIKRGSVYSSVMDYSYSELNQLTTLGKYDIAALRFGYNREVEATNQLQPIVIGPGQTIHQAAYEARARVKPYEFCTDENAGASLTCNRFDEGTSVTEITRHKISRYYQDSKNYRNFRGDYLNRKFSETQMVDYIRGLYSRFMPLRANFEAWVSLKNNLARYGAPYNTIAYRGCDAKTRTQEVALCEYVDDINIASRESVRFLIDIVKTTDLTCLVAGEDKKISPRYLADMRVTKYNFRGDKFPASSCFDKEVKEFIASKSSVVVAQSGTYLNNIPSLRKRSMRSTVGDLDVRGNWLDKLIATELLFSNERMGSVGANIHESVVNHPGFGPELLNLVDHFSTGVQLKAPNYWNKENGEKVIPYVMTDLNNEVNQPLDKRYNSFLGIPDEETFDVGQVLLNKAISSNFTFSTDVSSKRGRHIRANSFASKYGNLSVRSTRRLDGQFGEAIIAEVQDGERVYGASKNDKLALKLINVINGNNEINKRLEKVLIKEVKTEAETEEVVQAVVQALTGTDIEVEAATEQEQEQEQVISPGGPDGTFLLESKDSQGRTIHTPCFIEENGSCTPVSQETEVTEADEIEVTAAEEAEITVETEAPTEAPKYDIERLSNILSIKTLVNIFARDLNITQAMLQAKRPIKEMVALLGPDRFNNVKFILSLLNNQAENADEHTTFLLDSELTGQDIQMFLNPEFEEKKTEDFLDKLFFLYKR